MNRISQKSLRVCFVAAILFAILSLFFFHGITRAEKLKCSEFFTSCSDGSPGWRAEGCVIRCGPDGAEEIQCAVPMN